MNNDGYNDWLAFTPSAQMVVTSLKSNFRLFWAFLKFFYTDFCFYDTLPVKYFHHIITIYVENLFLSYWLVVRNNTYSNFIYLISERFKTVLEPSKTVGYYPRAWFGSEILTPQSIRYIESSVTSKAH